MREAIPWVGALFVLSIVGCIYDDAAAQVQSAEQRACIVSLNTNAGNVGGQQGKENLSCLKQARKGTLAGSAQACLTADADGKLAAKVAKTLDDEVKKCASPPSFAYAGGAAVNAAAQNGRLRCFADLFGSNLDASAIACATSAAGCKCQSVVARATEKIARTKWALFLKCKKKALKTGAASAADIAKCVEDLATPGSIAADGKGRIGAAVDKLGDVIGKQCDEPGVTTAFANGRCASLAGAALASCIDQRVECRICQAANETDGLSVNCDLFDDGLANSSCDAPADCDDGSLCTVDTYAGGNCTNTPGNTGAVCRPSTDACDPEEVCDGVAASCPADDVYAGTPCADQCLNLLDDPPAPVIDVAEQTVCAETCRGLTNFSPSCNSDGCADECLPGETCIEGECVCEAAATVCQPIDTPTPDCALDIDRSDCDFLVPVGITNPVPYEYHFVEVNGYQDEDLFIYVNPEGLLAPGSIYSPYLVACEPGRGQFYSPNSSTQRDAIESSSGRIGNWKLLEEHTLKRVDCASLQESSFQSMPASDVMLHRGYYVRFTPGPGEFGNAYNRLAILVQHPGATAADTFHLIWYVINILPGPAPDVPPPGGTCGNGIHEPASEECDGSAPLTCPANLFGSGASGTATCDLDCTLNWSGCSSNCGNGSLAGVEVCDGTSLRGQTCAGLGFAGGTLACDAGCSSYDTGGCRDWGRAFVTSGSLTGSLGGIGGGDAFCQNAADSASLGGSWTAWLSTSTTDARSRVAGFEYRLVDDTTVVSESGEELFTGSLLAPINKHEANGLSSFSGARTGTNNDGTRAADTCNDWMSGAVTDFAATGNVNSTSEWSAAPVSQNCLVSAGTYCFEQLPFRRVFVTSATYDANLGGLIGADLLCQQHAEAGLLGRTWKAWLSTSSVDAMDRIADAQYQLVDGTMVAASKADLIDGTLLSAIDLDELGFLRSGPVWTGTNNNGTAGPHNCSEWMSNTGTGNYGMAGEPVSASMQWSSVVDDSAPCASLARLYCFEE